MRFLATFSPFVYHLVSIKLIRNLQESLFYHNEDDFICENPWHITNEDLVP